MQKKSVMLFKNKRVKLVQKNNFILTGVISDVFGDSLLFETDQKTSLISFDIISEIVSLDGDIQ